MGYAFNTMKAGMLALAVAVLLGGPLDPAEAKSAKQCTLTVSDCTGDWNEKRYPDPISESGLTASLGGSSAAPRSAGFGLGLGVEVPG